MKLHTENALFSHGGNEAAGVRCGRENMLWVSRNEVVTVNEVEVCALGNSRKEGILCPLKHLVPPHVGHALSRHGSQAGDSPWDQSQTLNGPPLVTVLREQLHTQADSKKGALLFEHRLPQGLDPSSGTKFVHPS